MGSLIVKNISKSIGNKKILDNISFSIESGDILAFIGPNGAGKTTTIKCILGLQKIDAGSITINEFDIAKDFKEAIRHVGCLVESPDVYMYMTGFENLKMQGSYYKINEDKIIEVVKFVGLENRINDKVRTYSLGMRQRLGIAIALLNDPDILLLDEPTNGLDPEGIIEFRNLIKQIADKNVAILISSHNLKELETVANKVCIISKGAVVEESDISKLSSEQKMYTFKVDDTSKIKKSMKIDKIIDEHSFEVNVSEKEFAKLICNLVKSDIKVYEIVQSEKSLEELYMENVGGNEID